MEKMKKRIRGIAAALAVIVAAAGAYAADFPAYLKMSGTKIVGCDGDKAPASLEIPDGVTEIGE